MINMTTHSAFILSKASDLISSVEKNQSKIDGKAKYFLENVNRLKNSGEIRGKVKALSNEMSSIKSEIASVNEKRVHFSETLKTYGKEVLDSSNKVGVINKLIQSTDGSNKGKIKVSDETVLRMKEGKLKTLNAGCIKNLFNKGRYSKEIAAASKEYGTGGNDVTVGFIKREIKGYESTLKKHEEKYFAEMNDCEKLNEKVRGIEQRQVKISDDMKIIDTDFQIAIKGNIRENGRGTNLNLNSGNKDVKKTERSNEFGLIYQSNAGCRVLNAVAREIFRNGVDKSALHIKSSTIYDEYKLAHSDNLRPKEWQRVKADIENFCDENLAEHVKTAADDYYKPTGNFTKSFRSQGITISGYKEIEKALKNAQEKNPNNFPVFKAAQFFSTSKKEKVAEDFSAGISDEKIIKFVVTGNSGSGINVPSSLQFNNGGESEHLYSPKACFLVKKVEGNTIHLQEANYNEEASPMPY